MRNKICEGESKMCKINSTEEDRMNTRPVDERTSCFDSEDDQFDQKERRSAPCNVTKANCYW